MTLVSNFIGSLLPYLSVLNLILKHLISVLCFVQFLAWFSASAFHAPSYCLKSLQFFLGQISNFFRAKFTNLVSFTNDTPKSSTRICDIYSLFGSNTISRFFQKLKKFSRFHSLQGLASGLLIQEAMNPALCKCIFRKHPLLSLKTDRSLCQC